MTVKGTIRRIFWAYPSAAGGWYVVIFKRGFHVKFDGAWQ